MSRIAQQTNHDLREQLKAERARFKALDADKKAMWASIETANLQEWENLKRAWQDSADEIKHIHRKMLPNFPRIECPVCQCDCTPILGSNGRDMYGCIACGHEVIR